MENILGNKRERQENNNEEQEIVKKPKLEDDFNNIKAALKEYKTIQQIKNEAIQDYNNLTESQRKNNSFLIKINAKFDILENINFEILVNDLIQIEENIKKGQQNSEKSKNDKNNNNQEEIYINNFIENYKKYRFTIQTKKRIELLNKFLGLNLILKDITFANEKREPKDILKEVLLNLNDLYSKCSNKLEFKPSSFIKEFQEILNSYDYDLKEKFFAPANFGNMNYKFSLLLSDFLKNFKNTLYINQLAKDTDNSNIKRKFEKRIYVIRLFFNTIKNKDNILRDDLYYKYLRIIYFILDIYSGTRKNNSIISLIKQINDCMINLIKKQDLKNYIKNNPKVLYIKRNNINIEINDNIIDSLNMNEILIYKDTDVDLKFDIKKYNVNVLSNLKNNLEDRNWLNSNFEYIEEYNFIYNSVDLKREFYNHIKEILQSPYIKNIYKKTETRFNPDAPYIFDTNQILEEIFANIHFFPFPFDNVYGYCDKSTLDIYITLYDNSEYSMELLGKLSANTNDSCHEIFHISSLYIIMNSENKSFSDFYSKVPSKKKKEYIEEQNNFLALTQSDELKVKKDDIDFGDAIEIECYGYCIKEFYLFNVLNLFDKNTWYIEEKYRNFKENYIKWNKLNKPKNEPNDDNKNKKQEDEDKINDDNKNKKQEDDDKINDNNKNKKQENNDKINDDNKNKKQENNEKINDDNKKPENNDKINDDNKNQKQENNDKINDNSKNKKEEDDAINIDTYINSSEILKVFFRLFKPEKNEKYNNVLLFKRKRESIGDEGIVLFKRELCDIPHTNPRKIYKEID